MSKEQYIEHLGYYISKSDCDWDSGETPWNGIIAVDRMEMARQKLMSLDNDAQQEALDEVKAVYYGSDELPEPLTARDTPIGVELVDIFDKQIEEDFRSEYQRQEEARNSPEQRYDDERR